MSNNHRATGLLPEASQIAALLDDVMSPPGRVPFPDDDPPPTRPAGARAHAPPPGTGADHNWTAGELFAHVNWANRPDAPRPRPRRGGDAPAANGKPLPLASLALGEVLGLVNWANDPAAARRPPGVPGDGPGGEAAAEFSVSRVMDTFRWD